MIYPTQLLRNLIEEINEFPVNDEIRRAIETLKAELPNNDLPEIIIIQLAKIFVLKQRYERKQSELEQKLQEQRANIVFWCYASACANKQADCQTCINTFLIKPLREKIQLAKFKAEMLQAWCDNYLALICS